jgi:hypothetical protein
MYHGIDHGGAKETRYLSFTCIGRQPQTNCRPSILYCCTTEAATAAAEGSSSYKEGCLIRHTVSVFCPSSGIFFPPSPQAALLSGSQRRRERRDGSRSVRTRLDNVRRSVADGGRCVDRPVTTGSVSPRRIRRSVCHCCRQRAQLLLMPLRKLCPVQHETFVGDD